MEQRMHFQTLLDETIGNMTGHTAIEYFVGKEKKKVSGDAYLTHIQAMANYLHQRMAPPDTGARIARLSSMRSACSAGAARGFALRR